MMEPISLVIAPNYPRYRFFCDDKGLDRKTHRFVTDPQQILGLRVRPDRIYFTEGHTLEHVIDYGSDTDAPEEAKDWAGALLSVTRNYRG